MINFKITDNISGLITVTKPAGKPIELNVGELVKAEVVDLLASGSVTLKVAGGFLTARTDIPLAKGSEILLKVVSANGQTNELRLGFMGISDKATVQTSSAGNVTQARLEQLLSTIDKANVSGSDVEALLKALPTDISQLTPELKAAVMNTLQQGLDGTGAGLRAKLTMLLNNLPEAIRSDPNLQNIRNMLQTDLEQAITAGLRNSLRDTGVGLESKLRAIADVVESVRLSATAKNLPLHEAASESLQTGKLEQDVKADLLRLRETLTARLDQGSGREAETIKAAINGVNSMLKDIETFQLMSKVTQSFYTYLPAGWQGLRDADISISQDEQEAGTGSCSCRINLDLGESGKLTIMVLASRDSFFVSFRPDNEKLKAELNKNMPVLEQQFSEQGLNLKAVRVLERADESDQRFSLQNGPKGMINIKA